EVVEEPRPAAPDERRQPPVGAERTPHVAGTAGAVGQHGRFVADDQAGPAEGARDEDDAVARWADAAAVVSGRYGPAGATARNSSTSTPRSRGRTAARQRSCSGCGPGADSTCRLATTSRIGEYANRTRA